MKIDERVAIITGGALGMGLAHCKALASAGARIVIADINEDAGKAAVEEVKTIGPDAIFVKLDVTSEQSWASAVEKVVSKFGRIDILVNNAGIYRSGTVESTPLEVWEETMAVNVRGVFLGSKFVIPHMRKAGGGTIINICSNWGLVAFPDAAAYVASKGAVRLLTKATASEVAKDNIRVNSVHPSLTITNMTKDLVNDPEKVKHLLGPSLFGRPARAEEIASAVLFLASDGSSFMTGSELVVDGGYTAV